MNYLRESRITHPDDAILVPRSTAALVFSFTKPTGDTSHTTSLYLVHPIYFPFVFILLATMALIDRATRFANRALPSYLISLPMPPNEPCSGGYYLVYR
jgi:hypothetical protein